MVTNRRLLIALVCVLLIGIGARFWLTEARVYDEVYYSHIPEATEHFVARKVYVCDQCIAEYYNAHRQLVAGKEVGDIFEKYKLLYAELPEDGNCPNHPDTKLSETTELPVHPQVRFGLPEDTEFHQRIFLPKAPEASSFFGYIQMTMVISSKNRRSIHRAESCLASQRWQPSKTPIIKMLEAEGLPNNTLPVRSLDMWQFAEAQDGSRVRRQLAVVYWYAALPDRITASEYRRLATMFYDRLVLGINYRWSYVLLSAEVTPGANMEAAMQQLELFAVEFAIECEKARKASSAQKAEEKVHPTS